MALRKLSCWAPEKQQQLLLAGADIFICEHDGQ